MNYLTGYSKADLLSISHKYYVIETERKGGNYDLNNVTKYKYNLIQHPGTGEYALEIPENDDLLDEIFIITSKSRMESEGWFSYSS